MSVYCILDVDIKDPERYREYMLRAKLLIDAEKLHRELVRLGPDWQGVFDEQLYPVIEISLDGLNKFENSNDSNRSNSNL